MVLAPDHEMVDELVRGTEYEVAAQEFKNRVAMQKDAQRDDRSAEIPKEGLFIGAYCVNPMTDEDVPIWLGNYVVSEYGSGAVMAVPAHDQRDFEFAQEYSLPIKTVIIPDINEADDVAAQRAAPLQKDAFEEYGVLIHSGDFSGLPSETAKIKIAEYMEENGIGARTVNYRLRDWCLSRQRYWGCPIPIIYREDGSIEPVPEDQLPVLLPTDVEFTGQGNPLLTSQSWLHVTDSQGQPARRETDTMDTFVDSSWYFLRYCSPHDATAPFEPADLARWMPVDQYVGGIEHATMHLIYARFFTKVLYDLGLCPVDEPFPRLFTQGMVTKYSDATNKVEKMSKSKGNVISLGESVGRYGADATRMLTLFLGPPDQDVEWTQTTNDQFAGTHRFLERVWRLAQAREFDNNWRSTLPGVSLSAAGIKLRRKTHQTILKVQSDIERFSLHTAIAALMEFANALQEWLNANRNPEPETRNPEYSEAIETMLLLLSPFAPHLSDELLQRLGFTQTAYEMSWPAADEELAQEDEVQLPVQINGKLRARISVAPDADESTLRVVALADADVQSHLDGREPKRVIIVPGRMVNIVV
jgi:leucyl-tRNA synthetase